MTMIVINLALVKPVGLFTLNENSVKEMMLPGEDKIKVGDVDLTTGPGGKFLINIHSSTIPYQLLFLLNFQYNINK